MDNMLENENEQTKHYWMKRFCHLYKQVPNIQRKDLMIHDSWFLLAKSKDTIRHVKAGNASQERIVRVVLAIEKLIATRESDKALLCKLLKNQRLVATI